jgi:hypothetical protein
MSNLRNALWTSLDKLQRMPTDVKSTTLNRSSRGNEVQALGKLWLAFALECSGDAETANTLYQQAHIDQQLEERGFQSDLDALVNEWKQGSQGGQNLEQWCHLVTNYHTRRTAYFVVHGWNDPIAVTSEGTIVDGSHRLRAAIYMGMQEVEIKIAQ